MPIFFVQYEARPTPHADDFGTAGGAYVNCWVQSESGETANAKALAAIAAAGWSVVSVEEACEEVAKSWYEEDEENRQYFEQAKVDGEVYVFHQWPYDGGGVEDAH